MKRFASRLLEALLTLWLLATLCFVLLRAAPGGGRGVRVEADDRRRAPLQRVAQHAGEDVAVLPRQIGVERKFYTTEGKEW